MNTVAEMREVAKRMNLTGTSKLRKSELYAAILAGIESAHAEALDMNDDFDSSATFTETDNGNFILVNVPGTVLAEVSGKREAKSFDARMTARINGYSIQRNGGKLTPKQLQRIGKKVNQRAARMAR